jgi:hypothetical protein
MFKILLILLCYLYTSVAFVFVDLNYPFQLAAAQINITTIERDLLNYFLVGFQDGQARRYSPDFSSFTALALPEPVDQFNCEQLQLTGLLVNGLLSPMVTNMAVTLSNQFTTLRAYSYPAFTQIESFNFTQPVLDYQGVSITSLLSSALLHVLVFNQTITVLYKNTINVAFDLRQTFGNGTYCTAVTFKQSSSASVLSTIYLTYVYY